MRSAKPVVIHYTRRDIAVMVNTVLAFSPEQITKATGLSVRSLKAIAKQHRRPSAPVLKYLELEQIGDQYAWTIR